MDAFSLYLQETCPGFLDHMRNDPRMICVIKRMRNYHLADYLKVQKTPPDFWIYLKNVIHGVSLTQNELEKLKELLPFRFVAFNPKKPLPIDRIDFCLPMPAENLWIKEFNGIGCNMERILFIGYRDKNTDGFSKIVYVLKKVKSDKKEGLYLEKFCRYFPKKIEAPFFVNRSTIRASIKFALHECIWEDGDYTWQLLHAAQGLNFHDEYKLPMHVRSFDLSFIYHIYSELGGLLGHFFKRYQWPHPSPISMLNQNFFPAPYYDLTLYNFSYNKLRHQFTCLDLSTFGDSMGQINYDMNGVRDTTICAMSHKMWIEIFMHTCEHKKYKLKSEITVDNSRGVYEKIRALYEHFCEAFAANWFDPNNPKKSAADIRNIKQFFNSYFIFPYRSVENAFEGKCSIYLKRTLESRSKWIIDPMYPCQQCAGGE